MFDQQTNPGEQSQPEQTQDQGALFQVEGRDYTAEQAQTKIQHADQHIQKLEQELARLRSVEEKLGKLDSIEELIRQSAQSSQQQPVQESAPAPQELDKDALLQELMGSMEKKSQQEVQQANERKAIESAKAKFGDSYQAKLLEAGTQLGMTQDGIVALAQRSPQAFSKLFGLDDQAKPQPAPSSSVTVPSTQHEQDQLTEVLRDPSARKRTEYVKNKLADALKLK